MAQKDQKKKKNEVPVGGNLSEPLNAQDIAEREAEARKDAGLPPEPECPEETNAEEPAETETGEQTPTAEDQPVKKPGLFGGKRGVPAAPPAIVGSGIDDGPDLPDLMDDTDLEDSIERYMREEEKSHIERERDGALPRIIEFAKEHAEIARKNNWSTIASSYQSLAAVAEQTLKNAQKEYWTKREKV